MTLNNVLYWEVVRTEFMLIRHNTKCSCPFGYIVGHCICITDDCIAFSYKYVSTQCHFSTIIVTINKWNYYLAFT